MKMVPPSWPRSWSDCNTFAIVWSPWSYERFPATAPHAVAEGLESPARISPAAGFGQLFLSANATAAFPARCVAWQLTEAAEDRR